jgi:hypothetical protein
MKTRFLDVPLSTIGYQEVKPGLYAFRASSQDCIHLLSVQLHGKSDRYLTAEFCVLNSDAEKFALQSLWGYGDPIFKSWNPDVSQSVLRFSVGEVVGWKPGAALWQQQRSDDDFARLFAEFIDDRIVPFVKEVVSVDDLLSILLSDQPPYNWVKSNGAVRAAEIAFLSARQGLNSSEIRLQLKPYLKEIEIGLGIRHLLDATSFIDAVVADAEASARH